MSARGCRLKSATSSEKVHETPRCASWGSLILAVSPGSMNEPWWSFLPHNSLVADGPTTASHLPRIGDLGVCHQTLPWFEVRVAHVEAREGVTEAHLLNGRAGSRCAPPAHQLPRLHNLSPKERLSNKVRGNNPRDSEKTVGETAARETRTTICLFPNRICPTSSPPRRRGSAPCLQLEARS